MTIGIASPASAPPDDRLEQGIAILRARGYRVVLAPHARDRRGYLAGSDQDRAADLTGLFARPDVHAVFCSRGGYGACRMVDLVDWHVVRASPKAFVGFSDITTLHLAFERRARLATLHGPMVVTLGGGISAGAADCFWRMLERPVPFGEYAAAGARTLVPGIAEGPLAGGCLSLLSAAVGTPDWPDFRGRIVLIEDVGVPTYMVDRCLVQLARAGCLREAAGFVVGAATGWRDQERDPAEITPDDLWQELLAPLGRPAIVGFPFGHEPDPFTLPLGCLARLDAGRAVLEVLEPAVAAR